MSASRVAATSRQEQVAHVHLEMLRLVRDGTDPENDHGEADNLLTRLVLLVAFDHHNSEVRRLANLTVRAWDRVGKYYA